MKIYETMFNVSIVYDQRINDNHKLLLNPTMNPAMRANGSVKQMMNVATPVTNRGSDVTALGSFSGCWDGHRRHAYRIRVPSKTWGYQYLMHDDIISWVDIKVSLYKKNLSCLAPCMHIRHLSDPKHELLVKGPVCSITCYKCYQTYQQEGKKATFCPS